MKTGGRREGTPISLPCLQPFVHRPLRPVTGVWEGHFQMRRFIALDSFNNRNDFHGLFTILLSKAHIQSDILGLSVRGVRTYRPTASDCHSVGTDQKPN